MAYRQELEDEQAASGYYVSTPAPAGRADDTDKLTGKKLMTKPKPSGTACPSVPLPGGIQDAEPWLEVSTCCIHAAADRIANKLSFENCLHKKRRREHLNTCAGMTHFNSTLYERVCAACGAADRQRRHGRAGECTRSRRRPRW